MTVFDDEQIHNAGLIVAEAKRRGLGYDVQVVGVCVGYDEASLRNVGFGDATGPDSCGIMQQRDPWGPRWLRLDVTGAAGLFFDRLVKVPNWASLAKTAPWQLAQAVQQSQFADGSNYQALIADARTLVPDPPTANQLVDQTVDLWGGNPAAVPEVASRLATVLSVDPLSVPHSFGIAYNRRAHRMPAQG